MKRVRVLIIEDNRDGADSLRMLLELLGYDVIVAYSGPEGLEQARQKTPDVVISDIGLPGLDGFSVARELRRHPATRRATLIAHSAYGPDTCAGRIREAGFDYHCTKPVDLGNLQRLLAPVRGVPCEMMTLSPGSIPLVQR